MLWAQILLLLISIVAILSHNIRIILTSKEEDGSQTLFKFVLWNIILILDLFIMYCAGSYSHIFGTP